MTGELTLDKYSSVTVTEPDGDQMLINIPPLSVDSTEGDLVLLDGELLFYTGLITFIKFSS